MNKTFDRISYHLRYGCDQEAICFEAQQNGGEIEVGKGRVSVWMWENNPYNSFFALKFSGDYYAIERESWYI